MCVCFFKRSGGVKLVKDLARAVAALTIAVAQEEIYPQK